VIRYVRAVLALQALWVLLSRPDMPSLLTWPAGFFAGVSSEAMLRFGIGLLPPAGEWLLWIVLHAALILAAFGVRPRITCAVAGLLLYHFAPFEELIAGNPHTFFGGLTTSVLGLLTLAFFPEERWTVPFVRLLFSFNYFCAFLAKMRFSGPKWFTAGNIRQWCIVNWHFTQPPLALWVANSITACWLIAIGTLLVESLFPLTAISRRARRVLAPLAALGHVGIVLTLGIWFPGFPLLLLYVDAVPWRGTESEPRPDVAPQPDEQPDRAYA
jgi:hypothetical protein